MKIKNGPALTYELVYKFFPVTIMTKKADGYYHENGIARGVLVKSLSMGRVMYHKPEELMVFKCSICPCSNQDAPK